MKKTNYLLLLSLFAIAFTTSCKKNTDATSVSAKKRYILTAEYNGNFSGVKYFVNDVPTTLGEPLTSKLYAEDLEVVGTDVYVLASRQSISGGSYSAVIYKNGIEFEVTPLSDGFYYNCLAVSGNDIYMAGTQYPSGGVPKVVLWKNGSVISITSNTGANATDAKPYDMLVVGTDVYIAGYETATGSPYNRLPKYWKNGVPVTLNAPANSNAALHRIVLDGNDVYCAGQLSNNAVYWKNGVPTTLSTASSWCYGIAISGSDIYTAGALATSSNIFNGAYWKNGVQTMLTNITTQGAISVYGIGVDGSDVYVIGSIPEGAVSTPVYWKNGELNRLPIGSGNNGYAYRLVIK